MSAILKRLRNMQVRVDESEVVVIDVGSGYIKAGFSGEDLPRVVIPTVLGERENTNDDNSTNPGETKPKDFSRTIGNEAYVSREDNHDLFFPMQRGLITDWDRMNHLLEHIFTRELGVDPRNATILMTDSPLSPKEDKHRMATEMFETFKVKAFALQNTAALSLFSNGTTTGLVAEAGEGVRRASPSQFEPVW